MADVLPSELPTEVRELDTAKTSVFKAGKLVYDGATQQHVAGAAGGADDADGGLGSTLSEMLAWGIKNSDPAELERRAAAGEALQPSRLDREALDVLLGQPTVAKMRACLGKVTEEALQQPGALLPALDALEELEYYVEDLDNANDLAKIGGVQSLLGCCSAEPPEPELRAAACGVLAAFLQNNPPFVKIAVELGVPAALLRLLDDGEAGDEAVAARAKALYALSALLRSSKEAAAAVLASAAARRTLLAAAAAPHARVRRRALFLLAALLRDESMPRDAFGEAGVPELLLGGAAHEDEEVREQALQLLQLLLGGDDAALRATLRAAGAAARLAEAQQMPELPEEQAALLRKLAAELHEA